MRKEVRLLNLSDIHFTELPNENTPIGKRNLDYLKKIKSEIKKQKPTHIIVNGDMVFSAKYNQYISCYETIFKDLLIEDENKDIRFILTPGNHSCQRNIPKIFFNILYENEADYKVDLSKIDLETYEDRLEFENKLKNVFKKESLKNKLLTEFAKHEENLDYGEELRKIDSFTIFDYLFTNYQKFVNEFVITRIEDINMRCNNPIEYNTYKDSKGTKGVIYDSEYNIVFSILNGVNYFWGEETYEDLYENKHMNKLFQEYGNLSFGDSVDIVYSELRQLYKRNILGHSIVCLLSHVPLSWISYASQFESRSNLSYIFRLTDIALYAHIHVEHFEPTVFRNRTYVFESAQLFEYSLQDKKDDQIDDKIIKSLGFSLFNFFGDDINFQYTYFKLVGEDKFKLLEDEEDYKFTFEGTRKDYQLKTTKQNLINCYDCVFSLTNKIIAKNFLKSKCGYLRYINGIRANVIQKEYLNKFYFQISDKVYIYINSLIEEEEYVTHFPQENLNFLPLIVNNVLIIFIKTHGKKISINIVLNEIIEFICSIPKKKIESFEYINLTFFDYSLYYLFNRGTSIYKNSFQVWTDNLELYVMKFKSKLFKKLNSKNKNDCSNKLSHLSDIGIDFAIKTLSEYESSIYKTDINSKINVY